MRCSVAGMSPSTKIYQVGWPTTFTSHLNTLVVLKSLKITKMLILKSFNKAFFGIWPALMGCLAAGMLLKTTNLSWDLVWNFAGSSKRSGEAKKLKTDQFQARNDDFDHPGPDVFVSCDLRWPPRSAPEVSPKSLVQELDLQTLFTVMQPFPGFSETKT